MKSKTKFITLLIVITLLLAPTAMAASYEITNANEKLVVTDDAVAHITQDITYQINEEINGVYLNIPLSGNQSITNISVETPGLYNKVEIENSSTTQTNIRVWLYTDEQMTQKVSDRSVEVIYKYDFIKGVKIYNDIAEVQYNMWGNGWDTSVAHITTSLTIPGSFDNAEYFLNPPDNVKSHSVDGNTLVASYGEVKEHANNTEQRVLMPKSYFKSYDNADVINKDAKEQIEADQKKYLDDINFNNTVSIIEIIVLLLLICTPFAVYYKYGREINIGAMDITSEIPYDDKPAAVNALNNSECGEIEIEAFQATLLDLINRGLIDIIYSNKDDMVLSLNYRKIEKADTLPYENKLMNYLEEYKDDEGVISLKKLKDNEDPTDFIYFFNDWKRTVTRDEDLIKRSDEYLDNFGVRIAKMVSGISVVIAFFMIIFSENSRLYVFPIFLLSALLIVESFIVYCLPSDVMGAYTLKGRKYTQKWQAFEKYISDYSLIKEYPPESVQVWGEYIVYATALGCAKKAQKNMQQYFEYIDLPEDVIDDYPLFGCGYYAGYFMLFDTFHHLSTPPSTSTDNSLGDSGSFGDIGDIGGGFGGGGGGVF